MAEEFSKVPITLQKASAMLVHHRNCRTAFICCVIILMAAASSISLSVCDAAKTQSKNESETNQLDLIGTQSVFDTATSKNNDLYKALSYYVIKSNNSTNNNNVTPTRIVQLKTIIDYYQSNNNITIRSYVESSADSSSSGSASLIKMATEFEIYDTNDTNDTSNITTSGKNHMGCNGCSHPEYIVFTWVLCLVALATALKLYYLIKTALAIIMVSIYTLLILRLYPSVFEDTENKNS